MRRAEIIERLEKAEGADRELDADIDIFLFGGETVWKQANYTMEMYPASRRASKHHVGGFAHEHVPLYTASLDATTALVERTLPGWYWRAGRTSLFPNGWANLHEFHPDHTDPGKNEFGYTGGKVPNPACALLVCLFRALEAKETGNG